MGHALGWSEGGTPVPHSGAVPTVQDFNRMLGFAAHAAWTDPTSVYGTLAHWQHSIDLAADAGLSWWRGEVPVGHDYIRDPLMAKANYVLSKGMQLSLLINGYWDTADAWYGTVEQQLAWIATHFTPDQLAGFELPNEPDLFHADTDWPGKLVDFAVHVHSVIRGSYPQFDSVPIWQSALCFNSAYGLGQRFQQKGVDPRAVTDFYNSHAYDGGDMPKLQHYADENTKYQPLGRSDGKGVITEWGYWTGYNSAAYAGVDEVNQARYILRAWATQFLYGIRRSSLYYAGDTGSGLTDSEGTFGLFRNDYTLKPSYGAVQRMNQFLGDPAPPQILYGRPYTIPTMPNELRYFQLQRADGSHVLLVWREVLSWNRDTKVPIGVGGVPVSIVVDPAATCQAYNPRLDALGVEQSGGWSGQVADDLLLIEIQ